MPRIKDYPKYEDHVDKTMTWDKKNKRLLPPGRTKLLQDGRFIFDMDDGTYTVSMQYFIENVLGLVNKDDKTIVSDIKIVGYDSSNPAAFKLDRLRLEIYTENIGQDGNKVWHKGFKSLDFMHVFDVIIKQNKIISCGNAKTINNDGFIECLIPNEDSDYDRLSIKIPLHAITNISVTDGKLTYKVGDDTKTLDLTSVINSTVSSSGEFQQKVSDLVDFRMSPLTPLINSAITSIEVSDAGNMQWASYDHNTVEGSFDFGALIAKKVAEAKPADLPTDLTRNLDITDSGDITWTVNGENKSTNLTDSISNRIRGPITRQIDALSQKVNHAPVNFNIDESGNTTWLSNGEDHKFNFGSLVDSKLKSMPSTTIDKYIRELDISTEGDVNWVTESGEKKNVNMHTLFDSMLQGIANGKADQNWVKDQISQAISTYSSGTDSGIRLAKFAKELNVNSSGVMTWTSSDGEKHSVDLKSFVSSSSVESISSSTIQEILKG